MPRVSGKDASITFASGYQIYATSWTINAAAEEVDITALGDTWKTWLNGVAEWSGSYTALIDETALDPITSGSSGIIAVGTKGSTRLALGASSAAATFTFQADTGGNVQSFKGNIIITGMDANATVGGTASSFTFTFRGSGVLVLA